MGTKFHLFKNEVNKVKKKNEIWSQNSIHFEGTSYRKISSLRDAVSFYLCTNSQL